ncbi:MAG: ABC transporter ATP-binding protein [Saccharospirillaceae bacterium]|nr:ABC transporter ATP-binding protein [Pseudomonadales bacterium]NRB79876.1 ABC transporter ATP-binding protein [Saccharospirillaceae bacterium]
MITLTNVSKYYPSKLGRRYVLEDVSLEIPTDKNVAILGPNGAGKSTLLRMIAGVDEPSKGKITSTGALSWSLGLSSGLQGSMTGRENTRFVARIQGIKKNKELEAFVKDFSGINDAFELPIKTYSSGMRSRLMFALSMAFEFDFYLFDELGAVGDKNFKEKSEKALKERLDKSKIILVSHSMASLKKQCDIGLLIHNKKIIKFDDVNDAIKEYERLY